MADTNFTTGTVVEADWLQEVNNHVFRDEGISGANPHEADAIGFTPTVGPSTTVEAALQATQSDVSDLQTDVATIESAITGTLLPAGGTTGQVLSKVDNTDYNVEWSTPPASSTIYVPVCLQLAGPDPDGVITGSMPGSWAFIGSALSSSTKRLLFQYGSIRVHSAIFTIIWTNSSTSNEVRVVTMDDGPTNITSIGSTTPASAGSPIVTDINVTSALDSLAASSTYKSIGYQLQGPGTYTIYEVRLDIVYKYTV